MDKDVFAIQEVGAGDYRVLAVYFLFVDADGFGLEGTACLAFGGQDGCLYCQEVHNIDARLQVGSRDIKLGNTFKDREEGILVNLPESIRCGIAEEDLRGFKGGIVGFLAMNKAGDFLRKGLLQDAQVRSFRM